MRIKAWLDKNTHSLEGKTVAVTGSTGGIGKHLCRYLAALGASLILMDRNAERSQSHRDELLRDFPNINVRCIRTELEDMRSVREACEQLKQESPDVFIHNAGAYSIPRHKCETGYDNIFQINFVSPYFIIREMLPALRERGGRVVAVGSIAHRYSKTDEQNIDFSDKSSCALAYGNAKRYLMFSLYELFRDERDVCLAVTHPGITFTNITAHYPRVIFAIIKYPMKVIFTRAEKASLCVLRGVFEDCGYREWIGPRLFDIWGRPTRRKLKSVDGAEAKKIGATAEKIYDRLLR